MRLQLIFAEVVLMRERTKISDECGTNLGVLKRLLAQHHLHIRISQNPPCDRRPQEVSEPIRSRIFGEEFYDPLSSSRVFAYEIGLGVKRRNY